MLCFDSEVDRHSLSPCHSQSFSATMKYTKLVHFTFRTVVRFSTSKTLLYRLNKFPVGWLQNNSWIAVAERTQGHQSMFRPREGAWHTPVIWPNVFSLGWGIEGDLIKLKMPRAAPTAGCLIMSQKSLGLSSRTDIIIEFYPEKPGVEAACHITWYPKISCSSDVRSVPLSFTWFLWFTENTAVQNERRDKT